MSKLLEKSRQIQAAREQQEIEKGKKEQSLKNIADMVAPPLINAVKNVFVGDKKARIGGETTRIDALSYTESPRWIVWDEHTREEGDTTIDEKEVLQIDVEESDQPGKVKMLITNGKEGVAISIPQNLEKIDLGKIAEVVESFVQEGKTHRKEETYKPGGWVGL